MEFYVLLLFVILKINNVISWSWWWTLAPAIFVFVLCFGYRLAKEIEKRK